MLCPNCAFECKDDATICPNCSFPFEDMLGQAWKIAQTAEEDIPTEFEPGEEKAPLPPVLKEPTPTGTYESVNVLQPLDPYALSVPQDNIYADPYYQAPQETVKQPKSYKTGIAVCLILAALLVCGAVALLALSTSKPSESETEEEPEIVGVEALHGAWANENDCIVFTLDGRFATSGDRGTFDISGTDIIFDGSDDFSVGVYTVDGDKLTVRVRTFGAEKPFTYYHVSEETNLSTSRIRELWKEYQSENEIQEDE